MLEVFRRCNVKVSCLGNHDTDFGFAKMKELIEKTGVPWLMSNLYHQGRIVGDLLRSHIMEYKGIKVGFFGLCEPEWVGTLVPWEVPTDELIVTDFVASAKEMVQLLKGQGAEFIIALTHMRSHNDRILAKECQEINLILGGHDHSSVYERVGQVTLIKSGTDFEEFSDITVDLSTGDVLKERVFITD